MSELRGGGFAFGRNTGAKGSAVMRGVLVLPTCSAWAGCEVWMLLCLLQVCFPSSPGGDRSCSVLLDSLAVFSGARPVTHPLLSAASDTLDLCCCL